MEKVTRDLILTLKHGIEDCTSDEVVAKFYAKYSGCDEDVYGENELTRIARNTMEDYAKTADNPSFLWYEFFEHLSFDCSRYYKNTDPFDKRVRRAIWSTLIGQKVRNYEGLVNGFWEDGE